MKSSRFLLFCIAELSFLLWLLILQFRVHFTNTFLHWLWVILGLVSLLLNSYLILLSRTVNNIVFRKKGRSILWFLWQTSKTVLIYLLLLTVAVAVMYAYFGFSLPPGVRIGMVLGVMVIISGVISCISKSSPVKKLQSS